MAKAKEEPKAGKSGDPFEEAARVFEETSDNSALSTTHVAIDGRDGNALLSVEVRGLPTED